MLTGSNGTFRFPEGGPLGPLFVSPPSGWWTDRFWLPAQEAPSFALYQVDVPEEFSFIQATDIHLMPEAVPNLAQFVHWLNSHSPRPAFLVVTGDLVMSAERFSRREEVEEAFHRYLETMGPLEVPLFNVLGNHDCACGLPREDSYWHKGAYQALLGPNWYSFNYGGWHFVVLDTNSQDCPPWESLVEEQFDWLRQDLDLLPAGTPLILFSHAPLFVSQRFPALLEVLSEAGAEVRVAAAGHLHVSAEVHVSFPQVVTGALSGSWWGKGGLSWQGANPDGSPQGYQLFQVAGGEIRWQYFPFP
ncbi:MAG TPA: hypothetical protein ENI38_00780 [Candidatus Acetothermia bacterium]|nr:hypothetical protein [Candidatus Acetothermia bacterium]